MNLYDLKQWKDNKWRYKIIPPRKKLGGKNSEPSLFNMYHNLKIRTKERGFCLYYLVYSNALIYNKIMGGIYFI